MNKAFHAFIVVALPFLVTGCATSAHEDRPVTPRGVYYVNDGADPETDCRRAIDRSSNGSNPRMVDRYENADRGGAEYLAGICMWMGDGFRDQAKEAFDRWESEHINRGWSFEEIVSSESEAAMMYQRRLLSDKDRASLWHFLQAARCDSLVDRLGGYAEVSDEDLVCAFDFNSPIRYAHAEDWTDDRFEDYRGERFRGTSHLLGRASIDVITNFDDRVLETDRGTDLHECGDFTRCDVIFGQRRNGPSFNGRPPFGGVTFLLDGY